MNFKLQTCSDHIQAMAPDSATVTGLSASGLLGNHSHARTHWQSCILHAMHWHTLALHLLTVTLWLAICQEQQDRLPQQARV